jgi:release factor glutamine methyltransferase
MSLSEISPDSSESFSTPIPAEPAREGLIARLRAAGCVFAEDEAALLLASAGDPAELERMTARRVAGQPLEHVLGWAEFGGQRIAVDDGVFVPRRRTEFLVDLATALATDRATDRASGAATAVETDPAIGLATERGPGGRDAADLPRATVVVDLCCGSGALGAVLATRLGTAGTELHAADVDPAAVRCARRNLAPLGGQAHEGDLYEALPAGLRGRVNILLANAPYVPTAAIGLLPPEARDHEPSVALDGGTDGLSVLRRVIQGAGDWLAAGGHLLVESSDRQSPDLVAAFAGVGLSIRAVHSDEHDVTVVIATRPANR